MTREVFKENFISMPMKSFVLVLSLSLFVYRESVHMPAKKKKNPFCRSGKFASRKDHKTVRLRSGNSSRSREKPSWKKAIKDHITCSLKRSSDRKNLMSG